MSLLVAYGAQFPLKKKEGIMSEKKKDEFIWSALVHIGTRMWDDSPETLSMPLRFDEGLYHAITERMCAIGMNMIVLDIGESLTYPSHPELAIKGSWSPDRLHDEVVRLRKLGLEPIPKLNFSATHDAWLGEYSRMLSTSIYYKVCEDVIKDVAEIFGKETRFFHLGYDEEAVSEQPSRLYAAARQGTLWWHDFEWFLGKAAATGMRPWIWADSFWRHPEEFAAKVPRSVLLSNWYYGRTFKEEGPFERRYEEVRLKAYKALDKLGYEDIPCATNWLPNYYDTPVNDVNWPMTVEYCLKNVSPERLKGFMMAPWAFTEEKQRAFWMRALDLVEATIKSGKRG